MAKAGHYIDDERFYAEMLKFHTAYHHAKEAGQDPPRIPNYIGECFMLIADNLGNNHNFRNYSWLEEMKSDGIENCVKYCHNFDPHKYKKPFAYFTQIIYYAFLHRIAVEQKQTYVKYKSIESSAVLNTLVDLAPEDVGHFQVVISDMMDEDKFATLKQKFEKTTKNSPSKKAVGVEALIEKDDE